MRGSRRHFGLFDGRAGDRTGVRGIARLGVGDGEGYPGARGISAVFVAAPPAAAQDFRSGSGSARRGRTARTEGGGIDQCGRDVADDRRDRVRRRSRFLQAEGVQSPHSGRIAVGISHIPRFGAAAIGTRRAYQAGKVLPVVHRAELSRGFARDDVSRDFAVENVQRRVDAEEIGDRRFGPFRFHGPSRSRDSHESPRIAQLSRRPRRRGGAHRPRISNVGLAAGSSTRQDDCRWPGLRMLVRNRLHRRLHVRPPNFPPSEGDGQGGRRGQGSIRPPGFRSHYPPQRVRRVRIHPHEGSEAMVLGQLHQRTIHSVRHEREEAARRHHDQARFTPDHVRSEGERFVRLYLDTDRAHGGNVYAGGVPSTIRELSHREGQSNRLRASVVGRRFQTPVGHFRGIRIDDQELYTYGHDDAGGMARGIGASLFRSGEFSGVRGEGGIGARVSTDGA
mmetsp:Transcript_20640/g.59943  ORF Transcript_20640/g.59943 Transcript_20640/m.59943 type:complete len:450 (-) Transcript_20640:221-1570(-)